MILAKLKEATKIQHQQLEEKVDVFEQMLNLTDYEKLLRRFYGFYAPIEPPILQMIQKQTIGFDYKSRLKTPFLEQDLEILNGKDFQISSLKTCRHLPELKTFAQTLGCLYVLEGATLGGQIIGRHLRQHLDLSPEHGAAFFNSYGANVGQMWKAFGAMATAQAAILANDQEIVAAAQETFTKFGEWLT